MAILFEHLFREFILERGYDYFLQGSISRLKRENNEIWATVQGSEDYSVYIELNDDGIAELDCTCPYFQGGHNVSTLPRFCMPSTSKNRELGKSRYAPI